MALPTALALPIVLGLPLAAWGGLVILLVLVFQTLNGLKVVKVPFRCHKATGIALLVLGLFHAVLGIGTYLGWF